MSWGQQVFRYCERAQDQTFWAEAFNASSNAAFLVVAGVAAWRLARTHRLPRSPGLPGQTQARDSNGARHEAVLSCPVPFLAVLILLTGLIGVGSFLFHTFATRWARLADVAPIGLFMVAYLGFAVRVFLGWSWARVAAATVLFLAASEGVAAITCPRRLIGVAEYVREPCLNGTMGYLPALAALGIIGTLVRRRHPAGRWLLLAAGLLLTAMLLRWFDLRVCPWTSILGRPRGTHALWHLLNAATLHVLLTAAATCGQRSGSPERHDGRIA